MSDFQTIWMILWRRATTEERPFEPFEIDEVAPRVAEALRIDPKESARRIGFLLGELQRLPEGSQYFTREGNAVVPLPEVAKVPRTERGEFEAYPFEL